MENIAQNIASVRAQIAAACERVGRNPAEVTLIAVSKTVGPAAVKAAAECGVTDFGENRVQEAVQKAIELPTSLSWHMIGTLQSNKAKRATECFSMIHSVDKTSLVNALARQSAPDKMLPVLMQVNVAEEETKHGVTVAGAPAFAEKISASGLRLVGLMTVAPFTNDSEQVRPIFRRLRELAEEISQKNLPGLTMDLLSMGMSGDYEVAIEEGATHVRVGSAIFGRRQY